MFQNFRDVNVMLCNKLSVHQYNIFYSKFLLLFKTYNSLFSDKMHIIFVLKDIALWSTCGLILLLRTCVWYIYRLLVMYASTPIFLISLIKPLNISVTVAGLVLTQLVYIQYSIIYTACIHITVNMKRAYWRRKQKHYFFPLSETKSQPFNVVLVRKSI